MSRVVTLNLLALTREDPEDMLLKLLCLFVSLFRVIPTPFGPSFFC